ncbi:MAG TPA: hypothetical protein VHE81_01725, partial [Lacipirellulaceae bacterium]|nr:hypothetical protein [Lacipirellulaceae bacterium]
RDQDSLQTAEPNQRSVERMLVDQREGVPPLIKGILNDLDINRLTNSDIGETMSRLADELKRLSDGPLNVAGHEITSARKTVESLTPTTNPSENALVSMSAPQSELLSRSLAASVGAQDDVIATLERLVSELSGKTDYRQLIRRLAELREDQLAHTKLAKTEIGLDTLPLEVTELSRTQRASLDKAAAGQTSISVRFAKIEQSMDQLARQLADSHDPMAGTMSDAFDLSHRLTIGADIQQAASDWRENRAGQALEREQRIADKLQQVLNLLRNEGEHQPQQIVDKLNQAERRLAALQQQLSQLKQQIAQMERAPNAANPSLQQQLGQQQQNIRRDIERLARELERLQAADASQSAHNAAKQLDNRASNEAHQSAHASRPGSSGQVKKAQEQLAQAAHQLADRRQQAEFDLALEIVRRFQVELGDMVKRQQRVLNRTAEVDAARRPATALSAEQIKVVMQLADEERQLAELAKEHSESLFGLGPVRVSLEEAQQRLTAAGRILHGREVGKPAQVAEQLALTRLEGMLQAFAQTADEAGQKPNENNAPPSAAANNPQQPPPRRPTFELLEVKMLRMLQADLNERTRQHERRLAAAEEDQAAIASLAQETAALAAEQKRLAELVQKMILRDNGKQQ